MRGIFQSSRGRLILVDALANPIVLLVVTGALMGLNFPLGKIAGEAHLPSALWALIISLGAVLPLLPLVLLQHKVRLPRHALLRYVLIAAIVSFVIPNILIFSLIPKLGAGYTALMFALSPVFTLLFARIARTKSPGKLGVCGILTGFTGATIVALTRSGDLDSPSWLWLAVALLIPVSLAVGNIYRTIDWPMGASPDELALGSHMIAALFFAAILYVQLDGMPLQSLDIPFTAAVCQAAVSGLMVPVFFRLQMTGGPVLLSQIGYIAAAVALLTATVFMGERYSIYTWLGAGVIAIGIAITIASQFGQRDVRTSIPVN